MSDAKGVLELYRQFDPNQRVDNETAVELLDASTRRGVRIFTLTEDVHHAVAPIVVATAMAVLIPNLVGDGRQQMVVENIVVDKYSHGKGYGRRLMEEVEQWAREQNCRKIIIVSHHKFNADGFYHALGYESDSSSVFIKRL